MSAKRKNTLGQREAERDASRPEEEGGEDGTNSSPADSILGQNAREGGRVSKNVQMAVP